MSHSYKPHGSGLGTRGIVLMYIYIGVVKLLLCAYYYLYINSGKSGSLFFVFSGKPRDGFLSNFAILFSILLSGL